MKSNFFFSELFAFLKEYYTSKYLRCIRNGNDMHCMTMINLIYLFLQKRCVRKKGQERWQSVKEFSSFFPQLRR